MATLWFVLAALMVTTYVVLDGFDIGAGIVHLFVAKTEEERALVLRSIGPVWDGNEVWLLASGGVLVLAFPLVYASAFSGFYLPLMIVLWLLIGRACAVELRHQIHAPGWAAFWDRIFVVSSVLLAVCLGAALGNVVRGVPLDANGDFFEPLWGDFGGDGRPGVLDGYTVLVGVTALAALSMHGALWVAHKLEGEVQARARKAARLMAFASAATAGLATAATLYVQPHVRERLVSDPWIVACPALAALGLVVVLRSLARGNDRAAFLGSVAFLVGMLTGAACGAYPFLLPSTLPTHPGLSVHNAASSPNALSTGLAWWIPGIALAIGYQAWTYRQFKGKVVAGDDGY